MKNLFFVSVALCIFSGTSLTASAQPSLKFIDGLELRNETAATVANTTPVSYSIAEKAITAPTAAMARLATEACKSIQFKYAQLLNREIEAVNNIHLFQFIEEWWATRYRFGGTTKRGIDCSAFSGLLMSSVFGVVLPRTAREQYDAVEHISKEEMAEGDMVFFNTHGGVSHVGVYLGDGYFVHASTSHGVTISNLEDQYYSSRFIGGGRALTNTVAASQL